MLKEIRFHGRGGQGVVTAAELLAIAAFEDGKFSQAFPSFGSERMGSPVASFARISDSPVAIKSQITNPDYVIVQDPTVIEVVDVFKGLKEGGLAIINVDKLPENIKVPKGVTVKTVDATNISLEIIGRPIPNTVMLGAFAGATGVISLESVKKSIYEKFKGEIAEKNIKALEKAYNQAKGVNV